ncbi:HAD family phosphatase [Caulobacter segnis]|uniref:HAD family hydrolase n=1 Tax=Caulobacter segnis TaxID=88688 RepID=UPI00240EAA90|nr:HAD family phosphatase [Caulobacter segnis]MDG2522755.1 HAD family phosphatase [Caulobacter segnis]
MSFPRRIEAVVFDMDGLLVDTETVYAAGMETVGREFGVDLGREVYCSMIGHTHAVCTEILLDRYGRGFATEAFWARAWSEIEDMLKVQLQLKAGVIELLDHLDDLNLPRAIATSNGPTQVEGYLGRLGVRDRFHAAVTGPEVTNKKPHPEPYLTAAARLGIDPHYCLALEDSHAGVTAAHGAGMMTVMVPDLLDASEDARSKCIHIADSLHHVLDLLKRAA